MVELNFEERGQLAEAVLHTLDQWGIEPADQVLILGLPAKTRPRELIRYRNGTALPDEAQVIERCEYILRIHHALELLFAHNPQLVPAWVTDPGNRNFGRAPLALMLEGVQGMREVSRLLENRPDWE